MEFPLYMKISSRKPRRVVFKMFTGVSDVLTASTALMMETVGTSETSVNVYHTTRCYNPEDSHLHTGSGKKLKSLHAC
jgi:hypothetical protein